MLKILRVLRTFFNFKLNCHLTKLFTKVSLYFYFYIYRLLCCKLDPISKKTTFKKKYNKTARFLIEYGAEINGLY